MKQFFTLIAAAMLAVSANAQTIFFGADDVCEKGKAPATISNGELVLTLTDTDKSKLAIDANPCYFGTAEAQQQFTHRLKTGGKSSAKNALALSVPSAGTLKIYVRTGSSADATRTLVLTQNATELYNQVVKEDDAVKVKGLNTEEPDAETNVYPIVSVEVKKGTVNIGYPVNGINFYGFEFIAGEDKPEPVLDPTTPTVWNFVDVAEPAIAALAENADWIYDETSMRYSYNKDVAAGSFVELSEIGFAPGAGIFIGRNGGTLSAKAIRVDAGKRIQINGSNCIYKIKNLVKNDVVMIHYASASATEARSFTVANGDVTTLEAPVTYDEEAEKDVALEKIATVVVAANGDFTLTQDKAINVFSITVNMEDVPTGIQAVPAATAAERAAIYNLAGQKVSEAFKGIVIKNGKKVVLK
jgi:hypothetical protein